MATDGEQTGQEPPGDTGPDASVCAGDAAQQGLQQAVDDLHALAARAALARDGRRQALQSRLLANLSKLQQLLQRR